MSLVGYGRVESCSTSRYVAGWLPICLFQIGEWELFAKLPLEWGQTRRGLPKSQNQLLVSKEQQGPLHQAENSRYFIELNIQRLIFPL